MGKYKDITGQRFGRLVAIRPTEKRKGTNVVWLFKCDCGNTVERSTSHLSSTSSCGCTNWHSLRKDITGQRFGRLVAIEPTDKRSSGGRIWRFRCDCGNIHEASIGAVTSGNTTSCGCKNIERVRNINFVDLTGRRFGMLEVIGQSGQTKDRAILWECKCDCGKIVNYTANQLNSGAKLNCGCNPNYKFYCVYKHVFKDGRVYIGKTSRMPAVRWHSGHGYKNQFEILKAIKELNSDNWIDEIEHYYLSKQGEWVLWDRSLGFSDTNYFSKSGAARLEKKWIAEYHSTDPKYGLNCASGGDSGFVFNEAARKRNAAAQPHRTGPDNPSYGREVSPETKAILSRKAKERYNKTGVMPFTGKHHTEATKQKLRESHLGRYDGEKNPFYGKHHTDDVKAEISANNSKSITQYDLSGKKIKTYASVKQAADAIGATSSTISACASKRVANSMGYIWRYLDLDVLPAEEMPGRIHGGCKAVLQYDMNGNLLNRYSSLKEAAQAVGRTPTAISAAIHRNYTKASSGGFIWKYESDSDQGNRNTKPVSQYDISGNLIKQYSSVKEAAAATGFKAKGISSAARGHMDTYKGFKWKYL